jgi:hypothetical protein
MYLGQTFEQPTGGEVLGRNHARAQRQPDTRKRQHYVCFVAKPARCLSPLRHGVVQGADQVGLGDRVEPLVSRRAYQGDTVLPRLAQQYRQVMIRHCRLDAAGVQILTQPFAELHLAHRRIAPGLHGITTQYRHFQRA